MDPTLAQDRVYKRKLLAHERRPFRGPNANVVVNARLKGEVSPDLLAAAVRKARQRHRLLDVRVTVDRSGEAWFTSEGAQDIVVKVLPRPSDDRWIETCLEEYRIPHPFEERPPIRFILLRAPEVSDLIIMCHHMMCDAMSLAYLARDVLRYLGDPAQQCEVLPDPPLANGDNIPLHISGSAFAKWSLGRLNKRWESAKVLFDEEDYRNIFDAYWRHYTPRAYALEFSEAQTRRLVVRCREEEVTVNTALLAALMAAQYAAQGRAERYLRRVGTAMDIRKHLIEDPGEAFGFYAGGVILDLKYAPHRPFWDSARDLHRKLNRELKPKAVLSKILAFDHMAPTLYDALMFKRYGKLVQPDQSRYDKLSVFSARHDALASFVKARRQDQVRVGLVLSNLTRLDFPRQYGQLALDKMMFLGAATRSYQKAVGVVTASGKLTMMVSHVEQSVDSRTMADFRTSLLDVLARAVGW
jgi:NRPS condensation-like uncharacterized protein